MENFDNLLHNLFDKNPIKQDIISFDYHNKVFRITVEYEIFHKLSDANLVLFNHKTKQYRIFTFCKKSNIMKLFKSSDLSLIIHINKT